MNNEYTVHPENEHPNLENEHLHPEHEHTNGRNKHTNLPDNGNSSIHDFDFTFICSYFSSLERQGPGSPEATLRALSFIEPLSENSRIADLGCGTGGQTLVLGEHTPCRITGYDVFPDFIDLFNRNAAQKGLQNRVKGEIGSMDALPFGEAELDVIWSEGAIYNIGFERGVNEWRRYLKVGGYLAVTEATWFTLDRPAEIQAFWEDGYPEIDTVARKVEQLQQAGYVPVATFALPENCWTEHFFAPQIPVQRDFLSKYPGNETAKALVDNMRHEKRLYDMYKAYYGYVFYIARKI